MFGRSDMVDSGSEGKPFLVGEDSSLIQMVDLTSPLLIRVLRPPGLETRIINRGPRKVRRKKKRKKEGPKGILGCCLWRRWREGRRRL